MTKLLGVYYILYIYIVCCVKIHIATQVAYNKNNNKINKKFIIIIIIIVFVSMVFIY